MAKGPQTPLKQGALPSPAPEAPGPGLDRKKLALIHIVKKELNLSDGDYRCILERIAGVATSKALDEAGLRPKGRTLVHHAFWIRAFFRK
ncbi:MAG: hypothetical protein HGA24_04420 [Candidatus Aminicenantes bacterium]|nr:hypothetical protein [Candidatus Aminicenantes bacterium]